MQQAVVVEAASAAQYDTLEVLLEGHNGQLPKLDMYHLLRTMGFALQVGGRGPCGLGPHTWVCTAWMQLHGL